MGQDKKLKPFGEIPESFKGLRDKGIYYTDKTSFISYLIKQDRNICVMTRPRRFGKTMMLRTLETFFEDRLNDDGKPVDNHRYFDGLRSAYCTKMRIPQKCFVERRSPGANREDDRGARGSG